MLIIRGDGSKMANVQDAHDLELQEKLDLHVQESFGIPMDTLKMLRNTSVSTCGSPKWSLRMTGSKIYLDLVWNRELQFPAKKHCVNDNVSGMDSPAKQTLSKKKKSPSTKRRDHRRFNEWMAKKRGITSICHNQVASTPMDYQGSNVNLDQLKPVVVNPNPQQPQLTTIDDATAPMDLPEDRCNGPVMDVPDIADEVSHVQLKSTSESTSESTSKSTSESTSKSTSESTSVIDPESETDSETEGLNPFISPADIGFLTKFAGEHCYNLSCLKPEKKVPSGLKKCTQCKSAFYCSRNCQAQHWKIHKTACGKLASGELC